MILVQGTASSLGRLHTDNHLTLLGAVDLPELRRSKMKWAIPIVAIVLSLVLTMVCIWAAVTMASMATRCFLLSSGMQLPMGLSKFGTSRQAFTGHRSSAA